MMFFEVLEKKILITVVFVVVYSVVSEVIPPEICVPGCVYWMWNQCWLENNRWLNKIHLNIVVRFYMKGNFDNWILLFQFSLVVLLGSKFVLFFLDPSVLIFRKGNSGIFVSLCHFYKVNESFNTCSLYFEVRYSRYS